MTASSATIHAMLDEILADEIAPPADTGMTALTVPVSPDSAETAAAALVAIANRLRDLGGNITGLTIEVRYGR